MVKKKPNITKAKPAKGAAVSEDAIDAEFVELQVEDDEVAKPDIEPDEEQVEVGPDAEHADDEATEESDEEAYPLALRILQVLAILAIGAGIALWAGPKIAPVLPTGLKPVAEFLSPQADVSAQIAAMQADFDVRIAKIEADYLAQDAMVEIKPALNRLAEKNADLVASVKTVSDATKALEASIADIQAALTKISAQQAAASQNGSVSESSLQDFENKLAAIATAQQKLNQSQSVAVDAQQNAERKLRLADATAALTDISVALVRGQSFESAITQISKVAGLEVPVELTDIAATGIASPSDLQSQLPELSRAVLRTDAAANTDGNLFGTLTSFLKSQVGTRSLEPQAGDGLDAVLSRIEGSLKASELAVALAETDTLSEPAKQIMGKWIASLAQLNAATNAVQKLQQAISKAAL